MHTKRHEEDRPRTAQEEASNGAQEEASNEERSIDNEAFGRIPKGLKKGSAPYRQEERRTVHKKVDV